MFSSFQISMAWPFSERNSRVLYTEISFYFESKLIFLSSFQDQKLQNVEDEGKNASLEDQGTKNDQNGESGQISQHD